MILEQVCNVCKRVREQSPVQATFRNLISRTRNTFKLYEFDIAIRSKKDKTLDSDKWYVMAYYDCENDRDQDTAIEVIVYHNLKGDEPLGSHQITAFLTEIFDATVHEFKHQRQSVKRKYRVYSNAIKQPYKDYLEEDDEIDAYAFSIAVELCRTLGKYRALRYMHKMSALAKLKFNSKYVSPCLAAYFGQFGDLTNPIIRRLTKKVYVRLQKIDTDAVFV